MNIYGNMLLICWISHFADYSDVYSCNMGMGGTGTAPVPFDQYDGKSGRSLLPCLSPRLWHVWVECFGCRCQKRSFSVWTQQCFWIFWLPHWNPCHQEIKHVGCEFSRWLSLYLQTTSGPILPSHPSWQTYWLRCVWYTWQKICAKFGPESLKVNNPVVAYVHLPKWSKVFCLEPVVWSWWDPVV